MYQNRFIKGRHATESILIVREVYHSVKEGKNRGYILKLDFKKAFDTVDWKFLTRTIENLGFGKKWIDWIKGLYDSITISVLVNGSPSKEFSPKRSLRQGDTLSPLFFYLIVYVLSSMLKKEED